MTTPPLNPNVRWWLSRIGFAIVMIGALGIVVATFAPYRFKFGPISISLRGVRNPMLGLLIGYIIWRINYDGNASGEFSKYIRQCYLRFRDLWSRWSWPRRIMLSLMVCQTVCVIRFWQTYPALLDFERVAQVNTVCLASYGAPGQEKALLEHFCHKVCDETPPNARILFHGGTPAMRFAYEVYPRRVFILPQEMTVMAETWHVQPQLRDLLPDPHEPYWHQFLPKESPDPVAFMREHEITYVATFDEYDLARCRLETAR